MIKLNEFDILNALENHHVLCRSTGKHICEGEIRKRSKWGDDVVSLLYSMYVDGKLYPPKFYKVFGLNSTAPLMSAMRKFANKNGLNFPGIYEIYNEDFNITRKNTLISKYGVDNFNDIPGVRDKIHRAHEHRYGGWYSSTNEAKERKMKTFDERYGGMLMASPILRDKIQKNKPGKIWFRICIAIASL